MSRLPKAKQIYCNVSTVVSRCSKPISRLLNFHHFHLVLKNKPDKYFVEIGPGFSNNSNKIWTYDFNVKNLNDSSSRPVYKRKSLINQSFQIKNRETPVVFLHGLAAGSAIWLLNFDQIFENGPRRLLAIDILGKQTKMKCDDI